MPAGSEIQTPPGKPAEKPGRSIDNESIFLWIVVLWICALLYFNPRLLALVTGSPSLVAKTAIVVFVICLDLFWFYTIYYVVMIAVSWRLRKRTGEPEMLPLKEQPPVAILYPTRNDFREDAVDILLKIDYPGFHLFILDDSSLPEFHKRIDAWAAAHSDKASVIRRPVQKGFKAGNLNYALQRIQAEYPFFAVCDDDGIFPKNFIKDLLPYLQDSSVAFVQARQDGNPGQPGFFGQAMGYAVAMHFRHYVRARQDYGFVMFYGHGALMRTSVWEEAGGFPELVTEDLAYSAKIRAMGYRGVYTERVICYEDYPPTFAQLRKRTEKWIRGTAEFLKLGYGEFYRSPKVPWFEKIDVLIHATTHFMAVPMLVFLLTLGTILPAYYSHFRYPGSFFLMPVPAETKAPFDYLIHVRYHIFWSADFYVLMVLTIFAPMLPVIFDLRKQPRKLVQYLAVSNFVYLSCLVAESASVLAFLVTKKAFFRNTHDTSLEKRASVRDFIREFHPNHPLVWATELVMGTVLCFIGWRTKNLWYFAPGLALLLSPAMLIFGWEGKCLRKLTYTPFLIGIFIVFIVTANLITRIMEKIFSG